MRDKDKDRREASRGICILFQAVGGARPYFGQCLAALHQWPAACPVVPGVLREPSKDSNHIFNTGSSRATDSSAAATSIDNV